MKYYSIKESLLKLKGKSGIYCIKNKKTGMRYIGKSIDIAGRLKAHFFWEKRANPRTWLYRSIKKNGSRAFQVSLVKICSAEDQNFWEKFYIDLWNTLHPIGYNCTPGGTGGNTSIGFTEEQKRVRNQQRSEVAKRIHARDRADPDRYRKRQLTMKRTLREMVKREPGFYARRGRAVSKALSKAVRCTTVDGRVKEFKNIVSGARFFGISESSVTRAAHGHTDQDPLGNKWDRI